MHTALVDSRAETESARELINIVNEKANDLNITLFSGGSLGINDADLLRILPRGNVIQAAALYPGYLARDNPDFSFILPPGVATEPEALQEALPTLEEVYRQVYDKAGIKILGFVGHHPRDTHIMCKKPVNSLDDLRGLKVRAWEQFQVDVFESLGISTQIIGQRDLYLAMQTGVVDCAIYPVSTAVTVSLQEVAPYASYLFPYVMHPWTLVVSESAFEELSPETQKLLTDTARAIERSSYADYVAGLKDAEAEIEFVKTGGEIIEPFSQADQNEFLEASRKVWHDLAQAGGENRKSNYERVSNAIQ